MCCEFVDRIVGWWGFVVSVVFVYCFICLRCSSVRFCIWCYKVWYCVVINVVGYSKWGSSVVVVEGVVEVGGGVLGEWG